MATLVSGSGGFKVDVLCSSAQELQQERNCLERKLNELRQKRHNLEITANAVSTKLSQVSDTNSKMMETLKVAKHKSAHTQEQANSLEEDVSNRRRRIDVLNEKIKLVKNEMTDEVLTFENKLSELSKKLTEARDFYSDKSLEHKITEGESKRESIALKIDNCKASVSDLMEKFDSMQLTCTNSLDWGLNFEDQKYVYMAFLEERECAQQITKKLSSQLASLQQSKPGE